MDVTRCKNIQILLCVILSLSLHDVTNPWRRVEFSSKYRGCNYTGTLYLKSKRHLTNPYTLCASHCHWFLKMLCLYEYFRLTYVYREGTIWFPIVTQFHYISPQLTLFASHVLHPFRIQEQLLSVFNILSIICKSFIAIMFVLGTVQRSLLSCCGICVFVRMPEQQNKNPNTVILRLYSWAVDWERDILYSEPVFLVHNLVWYV